MLKLLLSYCPMLPRITIWKRKPVKSLLDGNIILGGNKVDILPPKREKNNDIGKLRVQECSK